MNSKITQEQKNKIIDLYINKYYSILRISKKTNISRPTITTILNEYKEENNIYIKKININIDRNKKYIRYKVYLPNDFVEGLDINIENNRDRELIVELDKKNEKLIISKYNKE